MSILNDSEWNGPRESLSMVDNGNGSMSVMLVYFTGDPEHCELFEMPAEEAYKALREYISTVHGVEKPI